jgi:hypothetical protein
VVVKTQNPHLPLQVYTTQYTTRGQAIHDTTTVAESTDVQLLKNRYDVLSLTDDEYKRNVAAARTNTSGTTQFPSRDSFK